tara:strand:- start:16 stop:183 length:168 start_codon:yes stop_codon:yes gene_type:complete
MTDVHDSIRELSKYHKNYVNRKCSHLQDDISKGATADEVIEALQKILNKLKADRV